MGGSGGPVTACTIYCHQNCLKFDKYLISLQKCYNYCGGHGGLVVSVAVWHADDVSSSPSTGSPKNTTALDPWAKIHLPLLIRALRYSDQWGCRCVCYVFIHIFVRVINVLEWKYKNVYLLLHKKEFQCNIICVLVIYYVNKMYLICIICTWQ